MVQMKKTMRRLLCYLMTAVLLLTALSVPPVSAEGTQDDLLSDLKERAAEAAETQKEYAEEGLEDAIAGNRYKEWSQAIFADNLPWNYFHNRVQADIIDKNSKITGIELPIALKVEQLEDGTSKITKRGRADLYMEDKVNKVIYLWEVKPAAYKSGAKKQAAKAQLQKYIDAIAAEDVNKDESKRTVLKNGKKSGFTIPQGRIDTEKYIITYEDAGDGIIVYHFERKPDEEKQPEECAEEVKQSQPKKSAKDEVADKAAHITEKDPEEDDKQQEDVINMAEVMNLAAATMTTAEMLLAVLKPYTDSASLALKQQCSRVIAIILSFFANPVPVMAEGVKDEIELFRDMVEVYYQKDYDDVYEETLNGDDQDKVDENTKSIQGNADDYTDACEAQPPRDPLIIDFGAAGIELKSLDHGVNFDLDNNGFAEKTAWIGPEDGFLAYDRNGSGRIDNGGELFGDQVIMENGKKSVSGFEALSELDEDGNGVIDSGDSAYNNLLVWIDANHNGKSEVGEMASLEQAGVESISLDFKETSLIDDETGTRIAETADVSVRRDGSSAVTQISEFWFPVNSSDTTQGDKVTAGNVPDILQAIEDDETLELYELCSQFITLNDVAWKRYYLKKILYYLTGAESVVSGSRGGNIDARDLKVIEQFMGRDFVGVDGSSSPNVNAAAILKEIYIDIENRYYNLLNIYGAFGGYLKSVCHYEDENGKKALALNFLYYILDEKIEALDDVDTLLYDTGVYLACFDKTNGTNYFKEFQAHYAAISGHYADVTALSGFGYTYIGNEGRDSYNGTLCNEFVFGLEAGDVLSGNAGGDVINGNEDDDSLSGGDGNDTLMGREGNDTLNGGTGNDILSGGKGNDTYIFAEGYGEDTIIDINGKNTIRFQGLSVKDIRVNGINENDAVIRIKGKDDSLILRDFCKGEEYRDYKLQFTDASMHATDGDSPFHTIYGDEKDNVLRAVINASFMYGFHGDDMITGSDDNDVIYGNQGNDNINACSGNDMIFGGDGDDILDSGEGDDFLYGGKGDDTYILGKGYGTDIVSDTEGKTTVMLTEETSLSDLSACQVGENVVVLIKSTGDRLIIQGYEENNTEAYILKSGNESVLLTEYIVDMDAAYFSGTNDNDYYVNDEAEKQMLAGGMGSDRILGTDVGEYVFGDSGDDQLLTEGGSDVIFGGSGNDYISGGNGNDYMDAGTGNGFADGGAGNDEYLFGNGYGELSIMDSDGINTIMFGDGISADGIKAYRSDWNDLLITFNGLDDTLKIKNYSADEKARNFLLIFADGTIVNAADQESPLKNIYGTEDSEYMPSQYTDGVTKIGQDGDDQLVGGDGNDFLYGCNGNDVLTGRAGDDVLDGDAGNDFLYGEKGNDTYIFKSGYGTDTINDGKGENTIDIYGYTAGQIKAYPTNGNDMTIIFQDSDDRLVIEDFFCSEADRNFYLSFNGSSGMHATSANSPLRAVYGTEGDDYIVAMDDKNVKLYGENGNDNLSGGRGRDTLIGGSGNDEINGNAGDDTLDGGKGNDYLYGGQGNDTYLFGAKYGKDCILDSEGINIIAFDKSINEDMLTAFRTDWNDLTIHFKDLEDQLVIKNYFVSEDNRAYNIIFADGTKYLYDDSDNPIKQVHATKAADWMEAWSDDGICLYGDDGNDHLTGGKGNDMLSGGGGDDYLCGKEGNDSYLFGNGYGMDTIEDNDGENSIIFENLSYNELVFSIEENGDLVVYVDGCEDALIIKNFISELFVFEFAGGISGIINASTGEFELNEETTEEKE